MQQGEGQAALGMQAGGWMQPSTAVGAHVAPLCDTAVPKRKPAGKLQLGGCGACCALHVVVRKDRFPAGISTLQGCCEMPRKKPSPHAPAPLSEAEHKLCGALRENCSPQGSKRPACQLRCYLIH